MYTVDPAAILRVAFDVRFSLRRPEKCSASMRIDRSVACQDPIAKEASNLG